MSTPTKAVSLLVGVNIRAVESESLKVGKRLKIGKIGFDFLLDFLAKVPKYHKMSKNAIKCQNACTSGQGSASEYFFLLDFLKSDSTTLIDNHYIQ